MKTLGDLRRITAYLPDTTPLRANCQAFDLTGEIADMYVTQQDTVILEFAPTDRLNGDEDDTLSIPTTD